MRFERYQSCGFKPPAAAAAAGTDSSFSFRAETLANFKVPLPVEHIGNLRLDWEISQQPAQAVISWVVEMKSAQQDEEGDDTV